MRNLRSGNKVKTVLFMVLMIIGFFYLVYKGMEKSDSQVVACRDKWNEEYFKIV